MYCVMVLDCFLKVRGETRGIVTAGFRWGKLMGRIKIVKVLYI